MKEPCKSCPERFKDFGGCRCQAYLLTGDPNNTDPACSLSPRHEVVLNAIERVDEKMKQPQPGFKPLVFRNPRASKQHGMGKKSEINPI
jgi:pyrroloquinoline quinone biosynthesis protein E